MAVGHVRYSTTGATILRNVQPLFAELNAGGFAVGHNGNLTNGLTLRRELVKNGAMMQSTTDTEVILHLVAQSRRCRFIDRFIESLRAIEGAYSLVALTNKKLIGARDPLGIRPLVLGDLDGRPILTSETCALDMIGAKYVRDIEPGEIIVFDEQARTATSRSRRSRRGPASSNTSISRGRTPSSAAARSTTCARPSARSSRARAMSKSTSWCRCRIPACRRARLQPAFRRAVRARHHPKPLCRPHLHPADPERARDRRAHEAFGQPRRDRRQAHHPDRRLAGARHHLEEDRAHDARCRRREVHFRLASPPILYPDYYGIDLPDRGGLLAATHSLEEMREIIGADSLAFLSIDGMYRAMGEPGRDPANPKFSDHCFTGTYPTHLTDQTQVEPQPRQLSLLAEAS
jgi:amidophosphoribosyltransferase